jgi:hypothetical protein
MSLRIDSYDIIAEGEYRTTASETPIEHYIGIMLLGCIAKLTTLEILWLWCITSDRSIVPLWHDRIIYY